jgi:chromosome segregation ATPase
MNEDEVKKEIKTVERELERARHLAEKNKAALNALEEQRSERERRLALALRAQHDYKRLLEEKRVELARAEAEAELQALKKDLRKRDVAAEAVASAVQAVIKRLQDFDTAQEELAKMRQAFLLRGPAEVGAAAAELADHPGAMPSVVAEALTTLSEIVSQRADDVVRLPRTRGCSGERPDAGRADAQGSSHRRPADARPDPRQP